MYVLRESGVKGHRAYVSLLNESIRDDEVLRGEVAPPAVLRYTLERSEPRQLAKLIFTSGGGYLFHQSLVERLSGFSGFRVCRAKVVRRSGADAKDYAVLVVTGRTGEFQPERVLQSGEDVDWYHRYRGLFYADPPEPVDFALPPKGLHTFVSERAKAVIESAAGPGVKFVAAKDVTYPKNSFEVLSGS